MGFGWLLMCRRNLALQLPAAMWLSKPCMAPCRTVQRLLDISLTSAGNGWLPLHARAAAACIRSPSRALGIATCCTCHSVNSGSAGTGWLPLCRCKRAWLPPASTWLFPPRSALHDRGGWYFEWAGYAGSRSPMCASWALCQIAMSAPRHRRLSRLCEVVDPFCVLNVCWSLGLSWARASHVSTRSRS